MKKHQTIFSRGFWLVLSFLAFSAISYAQPTYSCVIMNQEQVSPTVFQFDIYLMNTSGVEMKLSTHQYGILFNQSILAGGTLSATLTMSELLAANQNAGIFIQTNAASGNKYIQITSPTPPGAGGATIIPASPGLRVGRVTLTNTVPFGSFTPNLFWMWGATTTTPCTVTATTPSYYPSKVSYYSGTVSTALCVNATNHTIVGNPLLNPPPPATSATWTGVLSNDWAVAGNWTLVPSGGVIGSGTDVSIPVVATNYPTITAAANCKTINIESGASLIDMNNYLSVATVGGATVNRNITPGANAWHLFMSPINESIAATSASCFNGAYLDRYNEPTNAWVRLLTDENVVSSYGYSINFLAAQTLVFPGTLKASPVTYTNLSYTGSAIGGEFDKGWNLVGNPYPSGINLALVTAPTGMNAFAYVWNGTGYTPLQFGTAGTIASLQGFFVKTTGAASSLVLPNAAKVHGGSFLKSDESVSDMLKIKIAGNSYSDETVIRFIDAATSDFDQEYDAYKLAGLEEAPQLYSLLPADKAAINSLPYDAHKYIPLGMKVGAETTYTINVEGIESFSQLIPIGLDDLKLGTTQDLRINPSYSFTAAPGDGENRFRIRFAAPNGVDDPITSGINIFSNLDIIHVTHAGSVSGNVYVYSTSGQLVAQAGLKTGETLLRISTPGIYMVKVSTATGIKTGKVFIMQ